MSVYSKLQSLLTAANGITGKNDTTLTNGMQSLTNGYKQRLIVRFYDYDGTLVCSKRIGTLRELPEPPTHEGFEFLGWSKTLTQIQAYEHDVFVNAKFRPVDGKTRLYITLSGTSLSPTLYFSQSKSNGLAIDWGDGSAVQRLTGTGVVSVQHAYASADDYVISLLPDTDCTWSPGGGTESNTFLKGYMGTITAVEFGDGVTVFPAGCLYSMTVISRVIVPCGLTSIGQSALGSWGYTGNLQSILVPDTVTYIGAFAFGFFTSAKLVIPESVTSWGGNPFQGMKTKEIYSYSRSAPSNGFLTASGPTIFRMMVQNIPSQLFNQVTNAVSFELGDIGTPVTSIHNAAFNGVTYKCVISVYTTPDNITSLLANIRNKATAAIISFKASGDTVYAGVRYAAGDTMLTSNP